MGGGHGGGVSNGGGSLQANIAKLLSQYPHGANGQLGQKSKNKRVIYADNPLKTSKELFAKLSAGATVEPLAGKPGLQAIFESDGSTVIWRPTSKSGSPAIDINVGRVKGGDYGIHFEPTKK